MINLIVLGWTVWLHQGFPLECKISSCLKDGGEPNLGAPVAVKDLALAPCPHLFSPAWTHQDSQCSLVLVGEVHAQLHLPKILWNISVLQYN